MDGELKIKFYAGCPIQVSSSDSKEKLSIGKLCIVVYKPRDLCAEELQSLRHFGAILEHEISNDGREYER